jgi:hypothetical protein
MTNAALVLLIANVFIKTGHLPEAEETLEVFNEQMPLSENKETAR